MIDFSINIYKTKFFLRLKSLVEILHIIVIFKQISVFLHRNLAKRYDSARFQNFIITISLYEHEQFLNLFK